MPDRGHENNKLYDPQTGLLIPFRSHSDALLAQLPLQHGMSKQHFNLLLDILRDPSFSMEESTLKCSTDVDIRISEYRRELAEARSLKATGTSKLICASDNLGPAGIPSIIFDLVLDYMLSELGHFCHEAAADATASASMDDPPSYESDSWHVLRTTLKAMSLVHRSWTELVQRTLSRRTLLTSRRSLRSFARSPACGKGVREFAYKIPKGETCTFFHEESVAREHWTTLASVVSRLTTLRYLCLSVESAHLADLNGLDSVLDAIEGLKSIEGLWLHSVRDHCPYLPKLCSTISKLPNLRFLSIWNWTCPKRSTNANTTASSMDLQKENFSELTPPKALKALQMRDDYLTTPPVYLSRLFQPRGSYSLDMLDLHITFSRPLHPSSLTTPANAQNLRPALATPNPNSFYTTPPRIDSAHLLDALSPLLPTLSTLAIKLFYLDTGTASGAYMHDSDMQAILEKCTNLKRLRLHRLRAGTHVDGIRLPSPFPPPLSEQRPRQGPDHVERRTPRTRMSEMMMGTPLILPPFLEELHMHYTYSAINWRTQDYRLSSTLSTLPTVLSGSNTSFSSTLAPVPVWLKRLLISTGETDLEGGSGKVVDPEVDLPRTMEICSKMGVRVLVGNGWWVNRYEINSLS